MTKKTRADDLPAEEGAAAERYELADLPAGVTANRGNLGRPTVVSVRPSSAEHEQLQRAAEEGHPPVSTLIRIRALDHLRRGEGGDDASVRERLARLEKAVFDRTA